jgi:16S rRNA G1207 methylase RsmC
MGVEEEESVYSWGNIDPAAKLFAEEFKPHQLINIFLSS